MTTTTPASMGEPLSEADRLAEIRNRAKHQKVLDHSLRGVRAKDHVAAVDDRDFLLGKVDALLAHNGVLVTEVRFQAERADSFRSERDEARARVGVLEGQLATAQAEVVIRDGAIVGRDKAIDSLEAWHRNWKPLVDAHMKRCSGCDACDSEEGDHV